MKINKMFIPALLLLFIKNKNYLRLFGQVIRVVDGRDHPFHCQEGGQVGGVGGDEDEREEPPHPSHYPARCGSGE